jgi:excisionase family DNA binding protein
MGVKMMEQEESQVYTVKDIQAILDISRNTAYELVKSRAFPVIKLGDTYRVSKEAFNKWLLSR